ncbi:COG4-domain-containing protein [Cylindrobasidium torrendii FP15055 ss-10]|uniref:Conserved oligomeric Golgi complex subunit 4 n=1 Tax=Cylindrobasidium torrendii FP15055 ss-10 TaxID=1314674 RepID=A0A0D7BIH4_9AGAR|nr:COG4-domain-containing protein [Cylindrobasidium torrendii FP15055 ss-10]
MGRPDPRKLTNLKDVLSALSTLQTEHTQLETTLNDLLEDRQPMITSLGRLTALLPSLDDIHGHATVLQRNVDATAQTAERVGQRVRSLDEEMRRIRESGDRVGQVIELRSSLSALQSSMDSKDWESATRHCARVMALPSDVISGPFAEFSVPTSESHLPPAQTLQAAREHLLGVFTRNFAEASASRDSAATSRFFKLFPAIGWEEEGLQAYASFVVDLVRVRAPPSAKTSSPMYFTTALTALFESIAIIVDQHQPVVEKYYGAGKMNSVIKRLLDECDRVVQGLVDNWEEERQIKRKLLDTTSNPPLPLFTAPARKPTMEEDAVDPREVDKVLVEIANMAGRWNLFRKFLYESQSPGQSENEDDEPPRPSLPPLFMESTKSHALFEELLSKYYIPMETWYTRTIIDKAHRLSQTDMTELPLTTTTPDDVFYVLKVVVLRILSTGSRMTVERMLQQLREVMERDYVGIIRKKLDDVYRAAGAGSVGKGDKAERESRQAFVTLLNDLDVSSDHIERLAKDLASAPVITQHFAEDEQADVKKQVLSISSLASKLESALRVSVEQLFNQLIRPRLRTFILDIYKDVTYVLDDDSYSAAEYHDVVRKRFIKTWESLLDGYKDALTEENFRLLFSLALQVMLKPWEKFVMTFKFTELGAIRFDRDLRAITTYLAQQTAFGDAREKFVRLQQLATVLNLDADEDVEEFYNGSGISWKLAPQEAQAIAALRI